MKKAPGHGPGPEEWASVSEQQPQADSEAETEISEQSQVPEAAIDVWTKPQTPSTVAAHCHRSLPLTCAVDFHR
jgi:hypothetical protein